MGLLKMLLTGDEEEGFDSPSDADQTPHWDENEVDLDVAEPFHQLAAPYDPERATRIAQDRELAEIRERDEVAARVGQLLLTVESLLRLLKSKGIINDLDLQQLKRQVDLEDGLADGEYHPDGLKIPSHCPQCEARIPSGKRLCQLCGHRFTGN
mgnify:CR=1 FL=1|jgi:hypothetical protein